MTISHKDVQHIAALSRLSLTEEEKELFGNQLNDILLYVNKLNELDTADVTPTSHVVPMQNIFRNDTLQQSVALDDALANAPDRAGDFYRVPKIIE
ncbi:MAG: Asp-tRNA(Asn)/Glu-tRNA(Gln) amidotransferase subunit GatC [Candidatus Magnetobacterium sp. LHC-1]|uniref:Aspartyl/glutamyl-tRNA(Asn/Gln) amidotransferase subunit C n=1 Tax=Candidatus Magnetobacterium casense TaxID=1455061 RepID=A0ABS6RX93_9BACT|nr:Asp-tRNA(Asn)/Glu-tRNA(Gln) amidotransferase subunit GatC [Candidatus Magnetobacterium casensis]MBF0608271.1 Asp-tRNA(Asn)/Glu-tRNA(Gln) amidotransferase subunit GatC [Nitrospirota bacterium]MBV6341249.1 Asp-tRNA(Asn)/Glu-tRNA(Gln) amidotransferase subunit GatC [Candidatus Magnetobacterium casensis]